MLERQQGHLEVAVPGLSDGQVEPRIDVIGRLLDCLKQYRLGSAEVSSSAERNSFIVQVTRDSEGQES
ncbi:MAG: hypothetical protein ACJAZO_001413 [Myxococcota bacterium]